MKTNLNSFYRAISNYFQGSETGWEFEDRKKVIWHLDFIKEKIMTRCKDFNDTQKINEFYRTLMKTIKDRPWPVAAIKEVEAIITQIYNNYKPKINRKRDFKRKKKIVIVYSDRKIYDEDLNIQKEI